MKTRNDITQGTDAWHHERKDKITGKVANNIMSARKDVRENAKYKLIAGRLTVGTTESEYESDAERGIRLEPQAIAAFEFETGKTVTRTGFAQNEDVDKMAYSPDGLIGETEDVEAKCLNGQNHVKSWRTNSIPDEHYWQVRWGFVVNPKLQKRHVVFFNPDIHVHPLHIITVTREEVASEIEELRQRAAETMNEVEQELSKIITL